MNLLTLTLPSISEEQARQLLDKMMKGLDRLCREEDGVRLELFYQERTAVIQCTACLPGFQLHKKSAAVTKKIGDTLAEYVLDTEENRLIRDVIAREYSYTDPQEIAKIEHYCDQLLYPSEELQVDTGMRRKTKVSSAFKSYLEEYNELHWQGFLAFRLKEYREDLREVVEFAIDEYLMERQYQEFISLLKYFVYIQEAKIPVAHLIHKGGHDFDLLNEHMSPIDTNEYDTFTVELIDQEINLEDMVVSALITVSPEVIHLHTQEPELQIIKTIMNIFEGRVLLCTSCGACQPVVGGGQNVNA
jgi:putative sporulation protein YtxC